MEEQEKDPMHNLVFDKGLYRFVKSLQDISGMDEDEAGAVYHILEMWDKKAYFPKDNYSLPKKFNDEHSN